jgi:putative glycosyltransferase (TIGR04348 family)
LDILILTPTVGETLTGNRCTAMQWAAILEALGHRATVVERFERQEADALIALHAAKSHDTIRWVHQNRPDTRIVVALTGTDLYPRLGESALDSLRIADRIVSLQSRAADRIPPELREKLRVIVQSAETARSTASRPLDPFDICVVGHIREIKDPLRAAFAARALPAESKIRIRHAGAIIEPAFAEPVAREQAENPRYEWLGEISQERVQALLASCQLQVLSSFHEGGGRVIGESVVEGTPLLAARNDATYSLLGEDYPGLYDAGDTGQLTALMTRAETDAEYRALLRSRTREAAAQFDPLRERAAWRDLVAELEARE